MEPVKGTMTNSEYNKLTDELLILRLNERILKEDHSQRIKDIIKIIGHDPDNKEGNA